jgi:molybdopterin-guanine dinucleotide biosynthesis protein A
MSAPAPREPLAFDAIVLAGGRGTRLGGIDKAMITIGASTTLSRALDAVRGADVVVVCGPERAGVRRPSETAEPLRWVQESPPGGGPVAALAAALPELGNPLVAVLACDLPFITAAAVEQLVAGAVGDGAVLCDSGGRRQPLCAVYARDALRVAMERIGEPAGASMRALLEGLALVEVVDELGASDDVDDVAQLEAARRRAERQSP